MVILSSCERFVHRLANAIQRLASRGATFTHPLGGMRTLIFAAFLTREQRLRIPSPPLRFPSDQHVASGLPATH